MGLFLGLTFVLSSITAHVMAGAKNELLQVGSARHPRLISQTTGEDQGLTWISTL